MEDVIDVESTTVQEKANEEVEKEPRGPQPIARIDNKGYFSFDNHKELKNAASLMIQMKLAPPHLAKEGPVAVAAALTCCKQFQLPQKAMSQMGFIEGRLTCYGSLYTALAERHRDYGQKRQFFIDKNCEEICVGNKNLDADVWGAVIRIKKKGADEWNEYTFTEKDAVKAGLDKPKKKGGGTNYASPWIKYWRDMLMHKCKKRAIDSEYASAVEGLLYHEDVLESIEPMKDVTGSVARDVGLL